MAGTVSDLVSALGKSQSALAAQRDAAARVAAQVAANRGQPVTAAAGQAEQAGATGQAG